MKSKDQNTELDLHNFIPKGGILKNSEEVYVVVLYTGVDTKLV